MRTSWQPYPSRSKSKTSRQGITISLGYPILFHWLALAAVLGLLLFSAVQHIVPLLAITVFLLVLAMVSWLWSWRSLQQLSCQLTLSQNRVFPGEKMDLIFEVANSKWLFLPWLEIGVELPYRLVTGRVKTPSSYAKERLRWTTSISGGQRVRWRYHLECKSRGDYLLGPLRLRSGDIFGLFPKEMILPRFAQLLVYPLILPVEKLGLPLRELVGETGAPRSIYEDTSRTMGARDYQYDDPFKRIHWKASAHRIELQARQYESTTSLSLLLILDVYSFCQQQEENEELFELAVTTVASLAYEAYRETFLVGLIANSVPEIQIPTGSGRNQLLLLLETLARVQARSRLRLHEQLDKNKGNLPLGTTLVIVTSVLEPSLTSLVHKLQQDGHSLFLVSVGEKMSVHGLGDIPITSVQSLRDLSRSHGETKP